MKISISLILLSLFSLQSLAQNEPRPETAIVKLECQTSTIHSENGGISKNWGDDKFNMTVYKDAGAIYIKEQKGTYRPNWWGGNLPHTPLTPIIGNDNQAGMDSEKIWGKDIGSRKEYQTVSELFINRLNGEIRKDFRVWKDGKNEAYVTTGKCRKIENQF